MDSLSIAEEFPDAEFLADWWCRSFEQSDDIRMIVDDEERIQAANHKCTKFFALERSSLAGLPLGTVFGERQLNTFRRLTRTEGKGAERGALLWLQGGAQGEVVVDLQVSQLSRQRWLTVLRDTSGRARLESHAQRLVAAIDSTPDVVMLLDDQFRLTFVNPAFQNATGYSIEDALGRTPEFLQGPDDSRRIFEAFQCIRGGFDWSGLVTKVRNDGSRYPAEVTISPIYDKRERFLGGVVFERDMTVRQRLEVELRIEHNLVQSIINSLDSAVYTVDRHFRLTHFNDGWKRLPNRHGWLRLEAGPEAGRSLFEYVEEPRKRTELEEVFQSVIQQGQAREIRYKSDDGHHWVTNVVPWRHEGEIRGLIYKVTDQTHFIGLQNQLYQAQKMDTIGGLAAGVAHDFNNLLLPICGNVNMLLLNDQLQPEVHSRLVQIEQAAHRAAQIAHQLLSFSRASDEQAAVLDFNQVISEAGQMVGRSLPGNVRLVLEPWTEALKVKLDPTRAQQMLLNLCINAKDAMPDGGDLRITNRLVRLTEGQASKLAQKPGVRFACCSVSDTGEGIAAEVLSKIFEPFFTTKEKGKGTGLGLSILQNIVTKAGGLVEVESLVGKGTTFHLYLPLADEALILDETDQATTVERGKGRILVVDDLELVLEFSKAFLQESGYEVLTANRAESAVETLEARDGAVDLVLTDYKMPGRNGRQLLEEVAQRWPSVKLVLCSGYLDDQERSMIEQTLRVRVLNKPYNISEATCLIKELLDSNNPPFAC